MDVHRQRWNERHAKANDAGQAAAVLLRNRHLLPARGVALDLACGRGANALLLAKQGLETHAWDFSPVALARLQAQASAQNLTIHTQLRDVVRRPPPPCTFDVILVAFFLERSLMPRLFSALKPGGMLFYQTFVRHRDCRRGPRRGEWRLAPNELLELCTGLKILYYREEGLVHRVTSEVVDQALLVGLNDGQ